MAYLRPFAAILTCSLIAIPSIAQPVNEPDLQSERHIVVQFDLPAGWKRDRNVMDPIWKTLGLRGINDYAFGAPVMPNKFASRSNPASPLYQAWFGIYTVGGGKAKFATGNVKADLDSAIALAELDQRSWLQSSGDPHPVATSHSTETVSTVSIDGNSRTVYHFDMDSHSDLSVPTTPLAHYLGMPPKSQWDTRLRSFHDVLLHIDLTFWYDTARDTTFVVYGASSSFRDKNGKVFDNAAATTPALRRMMESVKISTAK